MFGRTSKNLEGGGNFKEFVRNLQLSYENNTCDRIIHALAIDGP